MKNNFPQCCKHSCQKKTKRGYLWPRAICSHHTTVNMSLYVQFSHQHRSGFKQPNNGGHRFGLNVKKTEKKPHSLQVGVNLTATKCIFCGILALAGFPSA